MKKRIGLIILFLAIGAAAARVGRAPIKFARSPHIAKGKIAFSYHGDIWVANDDGSELRAPDRPYRRRHQPPLLARRHNGSRSRATGWATTTSTSFPSKAASPPSSRSSPETTTSSIGRPDGKRVIFATNRGARAWGSPSTPSPSKAGLPHAPAHGPGGARHDVPGRKNGRLQPDRPALLAQRIQRQCQRRALRPGPRRPRRSPS